MWAAVVDVLKEKGVLEEVRVDNSRASHRSVVLASGAQADKTTPEPVISDSRIADM